MRKQGVILRHQTDPAKTGRQKRPAGGIAPNFAFEMDVAAMEAEVRTAFGAALPSNVTASHDIANVAVAVTPGDAPVLPARHRRSGAFHAQLRSR